MDASRDFRSAILFIFKLNGNQKKQACEMIELPPNLSQLLGPCMRLTSRRPLLELLDTTEPFLCLTPGSGPSRAPGVPV